MIRGGRVLGCRTYFPKVAAQTPSGEILAAFLTQHYPAHPAPPEILVNAAVPEVPMLENAIAAISGHPVAIRQRVRGKRRRWVDMAVTNARQAIKTRAVSSATLATQFRDLARLLRLTETPERLECFDISHTQGAETVASCVVFRATGPQKSEYRRFNIRDVAPGDDYGALAQAVERRFARAVKGESPMPDLVLIDGGRGQLTRIRTVLTAMGLGDLPVVAVAKGHGRRPGRERLYGGQGRVPISIAPDSAAMRLVQQLRDEAHRFAITGHRQRRARSRAGSALETISGLGPRRRKALLQQFGGLQGISRAGVEDLARTGGISRALAERIYDRFHGEAPPADGT
jgi:excinuclease ABC subunit C